MNLRGALIVFGFERRRAMTAARIACWLVLALFPVVVVSIMRYYGASNSPEPLLWPTALFFLVPEVVCLMGLLLWATPAIHGELEGQTWLYLAMRPDGKQSVLLGKYLTACAWTASAGMAGILISIVVAQPPDAVRLALVLCGLVLLSSMTYGAVFILLGVVFLKRGMVMAVIYTLTFELAISFVPAVVNQLTVQYRLRSLLAQWLDWDQLRHDTPFLFSSTPAWQQVLILVAISIVLLSCATAVLCSRQLTAAYEEA